MRSKHLMLIIAATLWLAGCGGSKNKFTVTGAIDNIPGGTVYLDEMGINELVMLDSTEIKPDGKFSLSGNAPEAGLYRVRFQTGKETKYLILSIDKGTIDIKGNWQQLEKNYTIKGSEASVSLKNFVAVVRDQMGDFNTMNVVLDTLKVRGNDSMLAQAQQELQDMNMRFTRFIEQYADTTHWLPNALFAVQMLNPAAEQDYMAVFIQSMNSRFPSAKLAKDFTEKYNKMANAMQQQMAVANAPGVGKPAPVIVLSDPEGKPVSLASFKGKYVLIDFWASWCGPCRKENPNVVAAYNKFKDKNFTILGVSLDSDKDKWTAAIEKDNLAWAHVSDLKGWESVAARNYSVNSIPANFLVDPDGVIIARDLREEALAERLAEVLK